MYNILLIGSIIYEALLIEFPAVPGLASQRKELQALPAEITRFHPSCLQSQVMFWQIMFLRMWRRYSSASTRAFFCFINELWYSLSLAWLLPFYCSRKEAVPIPGLMSDLFCPSQFNSYLNGNEDHHIFSLDSSDFCIPSRNLALCALLIMFLSL